MAQIETLYGIEVIVHFPAPTEQKIKGIIQAAKLPEWVEGVVIRTGVDCRKGLKVGDIVVVSQDAYHESPLLPKSQFDFPTMPLGGFRIMTEHRIAMKIGGEYIFDADFEEPVKEDVNFTENRLPNIPSEDKE